MAASDPGSTDDARSVDVGGEGEGSNATPKTSSVADVVGSATLHDDRDDLDRNPVSADADADPERDGDSTAATKPRRGGVSQDRGASSSDQHDTLKRSDIERMFPKEADTLTAHGLVSSRSSATLTTLTLESDALSRSAAATEKEPHRRDTLPIPSMERPPSIPPFFPPPVRPPPPPDRRSSSKMRIVAALPSTPLGGSPPKPRISSSSMMANALPDDDGELVSSRGGSAPKPPVSDSGVLDDDDLLEDDDDTQTQVDAYMVADEPSSPTLSLASQSASAREVYRLFLASEYAPALALANELIAQGDDDPMLVTIARECRSSVISGGPLPLGSSVPPPPVLHYGTDRDRDRGRVDAHSSVPPPTRSPKSKLFAGVNGKMTLEQLAAMSGMSLDQLLGLLERFVAMGVLTLRPPP